MAHPVVYNGAPPPRSNPLKQIDQALGYGVSLWEKIKTCSTLDRPHLLSLTFLLEAHTEALFELCMLTGIFHNLPCDIIKCLSGFYSFSDQTVNSAKRGRSLSTAIQDTKVSEITKCERNYYGVLAKYIPDNDDDDCYYSNTMKVVINQQQDERKQSPKQHKPIIAATFLEDLGISAVSSFMSRQQQDVEMAEAQQDETLEDDQPPPSVTTIVAQEIPSNRLRLNLIQHKNATSPDLTTLQLFKAFAVAAKKADKNMVFLPIDSTKQSLSPLMSQKQIDNLTPNQLRLNFSSFYQDQHHSISGFIHIVTSLTVEELESTLPLAEWLQTYQYSIFKCKSQMKKCP
jgi:hypothetical protein